LEDVCEAAEVGYVTLDGVDRNFAVDDTGLSGDELRYEVLRVLPNGADAVEIVSSNLVFPTFKYVIDLFGNIDRLDGSHEAGVEQSSYIQG